ncbi:MAG: 50S ribosomal protein L18 [Chlamydiae bacterium]|nr:50S ribosomal protein L18 [Chlamydiota bacterium]
MESSTLSAKRRKNKRVLRIRKRVTGSSDRPRLCISKSNQYFSVQVIDDSKGITLASMTTASKEFKEAAKKSTKTDLAKIIGNEIAKSCVEKGVSKAVLDRRGSRYHGIIAAFADSAREKGLQF